MLGKCAQSPHLPPRNWSMLNQTLTPSMYEQHIPAMFVRKQIGPNLLLPKSIKQFHCVGSVLTSASLSFARPTSLVMPAPQPTTRSMRATHKPPTECRMISNERDGSLSRSTVYLVFAEINFEWVRIREGFVTLVFPAKERVASSRIHPVGDWHLISSRRSNKTFLISQAHERSEIDAVRCLGRRMSEKWGGGVNKPGCKWSRFLGRIGPSTAYQSHQRNDPLSDNDGSNNNPGWYHRRHRRGLLVILGSICRRNRPSFGHARNMLRICKAHFSSCLSSVWDN